MRDLMDIKNFLADADHEEHLVLCTLVKKSGSSYRGVGAKKVVALSGKSIGLLSGGCLEGSIERTARERWQEMPFTESFSTLSEEDRLMGYQTGCQGVIDILFEQIPSREKDLTAREQQIEKLLPYESPGQIELVIVGCGADAPAYASLATSLGWKIRFIDYRSSLAKEEFFPGHIVKCVPLAKMAEEIPQGKNIAVVLMTHNYEADLEILRGIKNHSIGYLGCLGPAVRYQRLKDDLYQIHKEVVSETLDEVVDAPAGIFPHSRSPEEIALSVVAQIQGKIIETKKQKVWTMILAAGASKRFGGPKALAPWKQHTFIEQALQTARSLSGEATMVITGGHAEAVTPYLQKSFYMYNEKWQNGMGSSIAAGVAEILKKDPQAEFIAIMPVDQPYVEAKHLKKLLQLSKDTGRCALTSSEDFMGPPAVLPRRFFEKALKLSDEKGLKHFLKSFELIAVEQPLALKDFDNPEELQTLER